MEVHIVVCYIRKFAGFLLESVENVYFEVLNILVVPDSDLFSRFFLVYDSVPGLVYQDLDFGLSTRQFAWLFEGLLYDLA